jgi:predicted type IV restriction endonuclease
LRAFCDTRRHSIVTRLPVERATQLSPGFTVEAVPEVLGRSRVYFGALNDIEKLRTLVILADAREVQHAETGSVEEEAASG